MKTSITRRDFLNGAALALAAGATLSPRDLLALDRATVAPNEIGPNYYPPMRTGMRGSHEGSYEVAHALAWGGQKPTGYTPLDETYDLVIVGGGISGLTSAYLYRQQAGPDKKILILDNHDDFGGHAKRNEFELNGRTFLGVGGSVNLEQMSFSDTVHRVLEELGVDLEQLDAAREPDYMLSGLEAGYGLYLNEHQYGRDQIVHGAWPTAFLGSSDLESLLASLDLPDDQKRKLVALANGERDLLDELSLSETIEYLEKTTYSEFLRTRAGLSEQTVTLFQPMARIYVGTGPDSISVMEGFMVGYPGMRSVGLTGSIASRLWGYFLAGTRFPLFPDGNASVARMLVRRLLPEVAPGNTMEDVLDARFDYTKLDRNDSNLRLRLNSTVVNARNVDDGVEVAYSSGGRAYTVRGNHCILACYNGMIPHLCPELPEAQKEGLSYGVKVPLVMTNVLLRSGAAVDATGPAQYQCPGSFFAFVTRSPPVRLGNYQDRNVGDDPLVLWMAHSPAPTNDGTQTRRDLFRAGRHRLYATPFATYEAEIKAQLTGMFGAHGFDAERDIAAITVNRWSHGYSYGYSSLYDPEWEDGQAPHEIGRAPAGRIHIANCDSEASAYLHAAIDAAARAVGEIDHGE
ncbi:MAG: NAD(P)-binding protein [Myxococcota bacterium]